MVSSQTWQYFFNNKIFFFFSIYCLNLLSSLDLNSHYRNGIAFRQFLIHASLENLLICGQGTLEFTKSKKTFQLMYLVFFLFLFPYQYNLFNSFSVVESERTSLNCSVALYPLLPLGLFYLNFKNKFNVSKFGHLMKYNNKKKKRNDSWSLYFPLQEVKCEYQDVLWDSLQPAQVHALKM
jgi:hypothetical protein